MQTTENIIRNAAHEINSLPALSRQVMICICNNSHGEAGFTELDLSEVAAYTGIKRQSMPGIINKLVKAGMIWTDDDFFPEVNEVAVGVSLDFLQTEHGSWDYCTPQQVVEFIETGELPSHEIEPQEMDDMAAIPSPEEVEAEAAIAEAKARYEADQESAEQRKQLEQAMQDEADLSAAIIALSKIRDRRKAQERENNLPEQYDHNVARNLTLEIKRLNLTIEGLAYDLEDAVNLQKFLR